MMSRLRYLLVNVVGTIILRFVPWRCKTGLLEIGQPDRTSPVLVTCNYRLTVERVKRSLQGLNAYLLVANSRGVNVWCSATGGLFTNHDIISVLKTSGIEERVDHRTAILPQLAATGIESRVVEEKTGWNTIWGPVYSADIPAFVEEGFEKTREVREVKFPWPQRVEMASAWAFPLSVVAALIMVPFWREGIVAGVLLIWALSLLAYLLFPLYRPRPGSGTRGLVRVFAGLGILWMLLAVGLVSYTVVMGGSDWGNVVRWGLVSVVVLIVLGFDFLGSTPVYKSGLCEERLFTVVLDEEKCRGLGYCEEVCPRNCYQVDEERHRASMPRAERCVRCGACIVQCPLDALHFESPRGEVIPPETIREFKLNMMGKRLVE